MFIGRNLKIHKKIYVLLVFGMVIGASVLLASCNEDSTSAEKQKLLEDARLSLENSSEDNMVEAATTYYFYLVKQEQDTQFKNPKKLDVELLKQERDRILDILARFPEVNSNMLFRVNEASIIMLIASYYEAEGEITEAVSYVGEAFAVFEDIVMLYPQSPLVRSYRAMTYESLPSLFEKDFVVDEDINFVFDYIEKNTKLDDKELEIYSILCQRARSFYNKQKIDKDMLAKKLSRVESIEMLLKNRGS